MTRRQMLAMFRKLGGKNPRNGLLITLVKYEKLPKYWEKLLLNEDDPHHPCDNNCGLCELYLTRKKTESDYCDSQCPLSSCECWCPRSYWRQIVWAILEERKNKFILACENLVKFLRKKLKELDNE